MIQKLIKYAATNLFNRKLRSSLTILSILIGITAIYALISFGHGLNIYIDQIAQESGIDKILIQPKGGFGIPGGSNIKFTEEDVDFVDKIKGVDVALGSAIDFTKIEFKDSKEKYVYYISAPTGGKEKRVFEDIMTIGIIKGRNLKDGDVLKAVLGYNYQFPDKIFKKAISVGDKIKLNDVKVGVIGFYDEIGNPGDDSNVYLTEEGVTAVYDRENEFDWIMVRSSPGQDPTQLAERITKRFRRFRDQDEGEEDFFAQTYEQVIETFTSIILILNGILILIALISVVVASVNIMNTMYTSVLDRTREIGVMKAIGAENKTILMIFVIESGILGLIGGTLGITLGFLISKAGQFIAAAYGLSMLKPAFPLWLTIGCLVFSFVVGAGSGLLPSLQASKLSPVDALRYE